MPTRVLFIGDVHFKHNNLNEMTIMMEKLRNIDERYDFSVVAGDILDSHEKIDVQLMNRAYDMIKLLKARTHVYICVGNHDMINNQQFLTDAHWMNGMKEWENVTIIDKPVTYNNFLFVPYVFPGRFVEALETVDGWKDALCIFAHQEIKGCRMGAIESIQGDEWDTDWPLVISGHIHDQQHPQDNVFYPGSVIDHGFIIFTFSDDGDIEETPISLGLVPKKTIHIKAGQTITNDIIKKGTRVVITGTIDEIAAHKKSNNNSKLVENDIRVVYKLSTDNNRRPVSVIKSFDRILEELVNDIKDETLTNDYLSIRVGK